MGTRGFASRFYRLAQAQFVRPLAMLLLPAEIRGCRDKGQQGCRLDALISSAKAQGGADEVWSRRGVTLGGTGSLLYTVFWHRDSDSARWRLECAEELRPRRFLKNRRKRNPARPFCSRGAHEASCGCLPPVCAGASLREFSYEKYCVSSPTPFRAAETGSTQRGLVIRPNP